MKKVSISILAAFILVCISSMAYAQDSIKCVANDDGDEKSFVKVTGDPTDTDEGIYSYEKFETRGFKFLLKRGHGIIRLEGYKKNEFRASTFVQRGSASPDTELNLKVANDKHLEAYCSHLVEE